MACCKVLWTSMPIEDCSLGKLRVGNVWQTLQKTFLLTYFWNSCWNMITTFQLLFHDSRSSDDLSVPIYEALYAPVCPGLLTVNYCLRECIDDQLWAWEVDGYPALTQRLSSKPRCNLHLLGDYCSENIFVHLLVTNHKMKTCFSWD